ncbi:MAG: cysteine desulfurase [Clostridia bacterium]|nr:cysteine desulfurase [Clostridia bacterium]
MIYLDNAATTKTIKSAADKAMRYLTELYFNPAAHYRPAISVKNDINEAADVIAASLGVKRKTLIFTSGASESNNTVFECGIRNKKGNIVISAMEHPSVYECALRLKSKGFDIRIAPLNSQGVVDIDEFSKLIDANTTLVSIIHVSNETGAVNDIKALSKIVKEKSNALFHSDGVQAFGKIKTDLISLGVDLYSASAHKIGGMKGIGLLYIKDGINIPAFIAGGGQQDNRRSGTENAAGIICFAEALKEYTLKAEEFSLIGARKMFIENFSKMDWVKINGIGALNSGYIVSLSFKGLKGEVLSHMLEDEDIIVGLGSACSSHVKTSRVLSAMNVPKIYADGTIRISFSPFTTKEELISALSSIINNANILKGKLYG